MQKVWSTLGAGPVARPRPWLLTTLLGTAVLAMCASSSSADSQQKISQKGNTAVDGLYTSDLTSVWNRLFQLLFVRRGPDGRAYGGDIVDPYLWRDTTYLLRGASHRRAVELFREFLGKHAEREVRDPLRRAVFQRDLRAVVDWLAPKGTADDDARRSLAALAGEVIRRVALPAREIDALGGFQQHAGPFSGRRSSAPTVSGDLASLLPPATGLCLGDATAAPVAETHLKFFEGRSLFYVCIESSHKSRASDSLSSLNTQAASPRSARGPMQTFSAVLSQALVPAGTTFSIVRVAVLIDQDGRPRPTRLVEQIHRTHYEIAPNGANRQVPEAFEFRRAVSFSAGHVLLPVSSEERRHSTFVLHGRDPFDRPATTAELSGKGALSDCAACHALPGAQSVLALSRERFGRIDRSQPNLAPSPIELETEAQLRWLRDRYR